MWLRGQGVSLLSQLKWRVGDITIQHSVYMLGLIWDIRPGRLGLELSVRGFSQRAPALLTDLAAALANFDPCGERERSAFENVRNFSE